jgi:DNA-binding LacI/PurR family transcriptional regulator
MIERAGDRTGRPTLEDVAKAAGVSRALVSIVIRGAPGASEQTRQRVLRVAEDLNYRPDARARLLARTTTKLLGVTYLIVSAHHADLLVSLYEEAEAAGYEVILSGRTPRHDEARAVRTLLEYRCDALLLLGAEMSEPALKRLADSLPVVLVGRRLVHPAGLTDSVRTDDHAGLVMAVEHLASLGHRSIAHIDGGRGIRASDRRRAYRSAMTHLGLADRMRVIPGGETVEDGRRASAEILATGDLPTAVIAYNDDSAWGAMRGLTNAGLAVPRDVSFVGYDGSRLSQTVPLVLTTVRQDVAAMARLSIDRAVGRIGGRDIAGHDVVLPPSFVHGETSGPPSVRRAGASPVA